MFAETRVEPNGKSVGVEQGELDAAPDLVEPFYIDWLVLV